MVFKKLFEKGSIGGLELKNRIAMPCISFNYCKDNFVTKKYIDFYAERARGGAGLLIVGACQIDNDLSWWSPLNLSLGNEAVLPSIRQLTDAIHEAGAKCAVHIIHAGKYAHLKERGLQTISASPIYSKMTGDTPREATLKDIEAVKESFATAVERARNCGFDAVELNCCSGYLLREFLSTSSNQRKDEYGGSLENRARLLLEVLEKSKARAGSDYPIICRLSADEFVPGGNGLAEAIEVAGMLERAGIDAINITAGGHDTTVPIAPARVPQGICVYYARLIKEAVSVPVMSGNRIADLNLADGFISDGFVDFITIGRPLVADPYLPAKAAEGRLDEITPCIACNEGCFDRFFTGREVVCTVNPLVGREGEPRPARPSARKKVLVVGGGPAGISAALAASSRGHQVALYEKDGSLGGQINLAGAVPGKADFERVISHWASELKRSGVKVALGKEVTGAVIESEAPDAVVVASGSVIALPDIPGVDGPNVVTSRQILSGQVEAGKNVVVIGGGATGCEVALYLAEKGAISGEMASFLQAFNAWDPERGAFLVKPWRKVTVVEMLKRVGSGIGPTTRWSTLLEMKNRAINTVTEARVTAIKPDGIVVERAGKTQFIPADTVVIAAGLRSDNSIAELAKNLCKETHIIGDATSPRKIIDAVREGYEVGSSV